MKTVFVGALLALCHAASAAPVSVASFSSVTTELAERVGGAHVEVLSLIPPDTDPHDYQPTPADLRRVSQSQLIIIPGERLAGYIGKLRQSAGRDAVFLSVAEEIAPARRKADSLDATDPHWWHSVTKVKEAAEAVRDALIRLDPTHEDDYRENVKKYRGELTDLDRWIKRKVAELPRDKRKLVTSHDAFRYFARDHGFRILSIEGVSPEAQPSSRHVSALIDAIKAEGVKAIFLESTLNPKVIREITRETGATIGGTLYAEGVGSGNAATYAGMMKHNVSTIVEALKP